MRYIGNKAKLLDNIKTFIEKNGVSLEDKVFCDLFSGTATVGDYFKNTCQIIANDSLYFAYAIANGKLRYTDDFFKTLGFDPFDYFNTVDFSKYTQGFCYNTFAPTINGKQYFSDENAKKIDFIRDTIDEWYKDKKINEYEKLYLIGSLIESVSKVSNVAGVYSAFLKIWDSRAIKLMNYIPLETIESKTSKFNTNSIYFGDALETIKNIKGDILYLDPPYTATQYVSQYHVLETIAKNDKPKVHGVGAHRDNGTQISDWCKKGIVQYKFEELIKNANFKYIVFSYSDAGIMSKEYIESVLKRYAKPNTYKFEKVDFVKYKSTRAVNKEERENTKNDKHYEWLFFIEKKDINDVVYQSPLNYIGGKYNIIPWLKEYMPTKYNKFYDLFGGGFNVGLNTTSQDVCYNEINNLIMELLETLKNKPFIDIYNYITKTIKKYNLEKGNKENYIAFRTKYNKDKKRNPLDLYLLMCFGFEHQFRFNSKLEFNNPVGNSGFNDEMLEKLVQYHIRTNELNTIFTSKSYIDYLNELQENDFVYLDPPYLISCGAYNDGKRGFNGWDEQQEKELLAFLDKLNDKGVKFMLSNMCDRNGNTNTILDSWISSNKNYKLHINPNIIKRNRQDRQEIVICNY